MKEESDSGESLEILGPLAEKLNMLLLSGKELIVLLIGGHDPPQSQVTKRPDILPRKEVIGGLEECAGGVASKKNKKKQSQSNYLKQKSLPRL